MKIVAISDTHRNHRKLDIPDGDLIIHAGDSCVRGTLSELNDFMDWYKALPHKYKIYVAGNHDWCLERSLDACLELMDGIIYLQDSSVTIEGYKIWGAPWTPNFHDWAFMPNRLSPALQSKWDKIPTDTDILITHGPPHGILDEVKWPVGFRAGCELLRKALKFVRPLLHICGHLHESHGVHVSSQCVTANVSIMNEAYSPVFKPSVFTLEGRKVSFNINEIYERAT